MYLDVDKEAWFPNLKRDQYRVTSNETALYNCIAHAAEKYDAWWWPEDYEGVEWPIMTQEETLECFIEAFRAQGYTQCETNDSGMEDGFLKVAIYVDQNGSPSHAARQLESGRWTSKLGEWEDIEHDTLDALEDCSGLGLAYGKVATVMKRAKERLL
jgi:hypothetical protein